MMISQPAILCLEATWRRLLRRSLGEEEASMTMDLPAIVAEAAPARPLERVILSASEESRFSTDARIAETRSFAAQDDTTFLRQSSTETTATDPSVSGTGEPAPTGPLTAAERRARAAALRALALSRGRRFDGALAAFTDAARLDPTLDLTRTPAFWKLERAAHEAAIEAYVAVGRDRDAAVLRARVRSTFRPKPMRTRQNAALNS